jgi:putative endonuclease
MQELPAQSKSAPERLVRRALERLGLCRRSDRDPLGEAGERLAARHLKRHGYRIIGRNLRVPMGEADLLAVAPDGETVVLVEVKARRIGPAGSGGAAGGFIAPPPEASITAHKRAKLAEILHHLARANGWMRRPLRIDAVAIEWPAEGGPVVRHHAGAIAAISRGIGRPS